MRHTASANKARWASTWEGTGSDSTVAPGTVKSDGDVLEARGVKLHCTRSEEE